MKCETNCVIVLSLCFSCHFRRHLSVWGGLLQTNVNEAHVRNTRTSASSQSYKSSFLKREQKNEGSRKVYTCTHYRHTHTRCTIEFHLERTHLLPKCIISENTTRSWFTSLRLQIRNDLKIDLECKQGFKNLTKLTF